MTCASVIARNEAISKGVDCFVASLLAMTALSEGLLQAIAFAMTKRVLLGMTIMETCNDEKRENRNDVFALCHCGFYFVIASHPFCHCEREQSNLSGMGLLQAERPRNDNFTSMFTINIIRKFLSSRFNKNGKNVFSLYRLC